MQPSVFACDHEITDGKYEISKGLLRFCHTVCKLMSCGP